MQRMSILIIKKRFQSMLLIKIKNNKNRLNSEMTFALLQMLMVDI